MTTEPIATYVDPLTGEEYDADGWPLVPRFSPKTDSLSEDGLLIRGVPSVRRRHQLGPRRNVGDLVRITLPDPTAGAIRGE